jgi:nitrogenase molybdenum-iron protein alpha/beta subunit
MRERFGIPYIIFQDTYSVADIDSALQLISETLNLDPRDSFSAERNHALALESEVSKVLSGKKFIVTYPFRDALPLAAYLCGLGMEPLLINVDEYCPHNKRSSELILKRGCDPHICHMVNVEADAAVLNALPFDICIGRFKHIEEGRPCLQDMSDLAFMYDYTRTAGLLKMLKTETEKTDGLV